MSASSCPRCGGTERRMLAPGYFECTTAVLEGVVPGPAPGAAGERPVYGACRHRYQHGPAAVTPACACGVYSIGVCSRCGAALCGDHGMQAADGFVCAQHVREDREQAAEKKRLQAVSAERSLAERRAEAISALEAAGSRALRARRVPGRYHLSLTQKLFGKVGSDELVQTEGAWPIGKFTWGRPGMRGSELYEDLETGLTPSGRIVPMAHGTKGDPGVEGSYQRRWLGTERGSYTGRSLSEYEVVAALERLAASVSGRG